jgi:predicted kinase
LAINKKTLYIIRGLPGTGKSTLAIRLASNTIVAADDFMLNSKGEYEFDPAKLPEAHQQCQEKIDFFMRCGCIHIAVHNTFTTVQEMAPYVELCKKYNYVPHIVTTETNFGSIHSVPETTIEKMRERFEPALYYHTQEV